MFTLAGSLDAFALDGGAGEAVAFAAADLAYAYDSDGAAHGGGRVYCYRSLVVWTRLRSHSTPRNDESRPDQGTAHG